MNRHEATELLTDAGWDRQPRKHGDLLEWKDPETGNVLPTLQAAQVVVDREQEDE